MASNFSFEIQKTRQVIDSRVDPKSPLAALYSQPYNFSSRYYPRDLGSETRGHYINFYINVANNSQYVKENKYTIVGDAGGRTASNQQVRQQNSAQELSKNLQAANQKLDKDNRLSAEDAKKAGDTAGQTAASAMNLLTTRKTKRITDAVALYMPETVNVQYGADWQDSSLTEAGGKALGVAQGATSLTDVAKSTDIMGALKSTAMNPAIAEGVGSVLGGGATQDFLLYATGSALNPQLEVLFKGTEFRQFQFDFLFSPHDSDESKNILEIIKTFKFHQAPELNVASFGRYFVPPSEFDIDFIFNGQINDKLHQIGTCVLTNMNVDYAPNGWATFDDGMPTQIRMTLQFKEVEIVTKQRVMEGY
jgi:hypothetical protein